jgi:HEAT repeat protein
VSSSIRFVPGALAPTFEAALRDVRARSAEARAAAAERLGNTAAERLGNAAPDDSTRAGEALRTLLDDPSPEVRIAALDALGRLGDGRAFEAVLACLDDPHAVVREVALIAASSLGRERALEAVHAALGGPHPELRFQAVAALAELDPDAARAPLTERLGDDDARVRAHAAEALATLGDDPATRRALAARLQDPSPEVRSEAAAALAVFGDVRAIPALRGALQDPSRAVSAAESLGALGAQEARDDLGRVVQSLFAPLILKACAAASLVSLGDPRGVEGLRAVLRAWRPDGRSHAVRCVGELKVLALADELCRFVDAPRGTDPLTLAEALASLSGAHDGARKALHRMAARDDEAGASARAFVREADTEGTR